MGISFGITSIWKPAALNSCPIEFFSECPLKFQNFNNGQYIDANLVDFALDTDFIGSNQWVEIEIQFDQDGFSVYANGDLAYDETSTDPNVTGDLTEYSQIIDFLQTADTLMVGTGSWWSSNQRPDGSFYDIQYSYLKNMEFTPDYHLEPNEPLSSKNPALEQSKLIKTEFFQLNGAKLPFKTFDSLLPGLYIRRDFYENGGIKSTKFFKIN